MLFCRAKSRVDFACAGPDMELIEGAFLSASFFCLFFFCLFWTEYVQWDVNDRNTVRKVVKLCSNKCLFL